MPLVEEGDQSDSRSLSKCPFERTVDGVWPASPWLAVGKQRPRQGLSGPGIARQQASGPGAVGRDDLVAQTLDETAGGFAVRRRSDTELDHLRLSEAGLSIALDATPPDQIELTRKKSVGAILIARRDSRASQLEAEPSTRTLTARVARLVETRQVRATRVRSALAGLPELLQIAREILHRVGLACRVLCDVVQTVARTHGGSGVERLRRRGCVASRQDGLRPRIRDLSEYQTAPGSRRPQPVSTTCAESRHNRSSYDPTSGTVLGRIPCRMAAGRTIA
jgi:hypothetical protein